MLYVGALVAYALVIASGRARAASVPTFAREMSVGNLPESHVETVYNVHYDDSMSWFEYISDDNHLPNGSGDELALMTRQYDVSNDTMKLVAVSRYVPYLCGRSTSDYDMWLLDGALTSRRALSAVINSNKYGTEAKTIVALIYLATGGYPKAETFSQTTDQVDEIREWSSACNVTTYDMSVAMNVTQQTLQGAYDQYDSESATIAKRGFYKFTNDVRNRIQKQFLSDLYAVIFKLVVKPVDKSPRSIGYNGAFISWHSVPKSAVTTKDLAKVIDHVLSRNEFWQNVCKWGYWGCIDWVSVRGEWGKIPDSLEHILMCLSNRGSSC